MVEDHDLVFRTRARDGSPVAGVPVVVSDAQCKEIWRGVTAGDEASVRMPHADYLIQRDAVGSSCTAHVEGVFASTSSTELVRGELPSTELDFVVPASHPLRVHVNDPQGKPVTQPFEITLFSTNDQHPPCAAQSVRVTRDGQALFERVQPTGAGKLPIRLNGGDVFASTSLQVDTNPDDIEVSFERAFPVVRMRIEDAGGKPLSQVRVQPWLFSGSVAQPGLGEYTTDHAGALRLPLAWNDQLARTSAPFAPVPTVTLLQLDPAGDMLASAELVLPDGFTDGERDLGTVRMKELPFVAQGYVVDDRDAALPGARVVVHQAREREPKEHIFAGFDWIAVSDTSGFFKLRGTLPDGDIELVCDAPDHVMMPLAHVDRGDKKVRIVMARLGTILSKVLLPQGMPTELVKLNVESGDQRTAADLDSSGLVRVTDIVPGKIRVFVTVAGIGTPVVSLEDVEAKPGAEVTDPRVVQVDLRQRVFYRTLHVNDPEGKPISLLTGRVVEMNDDHRPPRKIDGRDGVMTFVTMQPSIDVNVSATGFVTQVLHDVDKDMDVTLERAPK
jgi:hypothetical protein